MKITIDTKEDSHDDIKKVISMLQNMVAHSSSNNSLMFEDNSSSNYPSESSPEPAKEATGAFLNMFGDNPSSPPDAPSSADSSVISFPEDDTQEEEKEDPSSVEIIPY